MVSHDFIQSTKLRQITVPHAAFECGVLTGFALALLIVAALYSVFPDRWATAVIAVVAVALFALFVGRFIKTGEA
jgi:Mg/Co/Ni transporter MgtE